MLQQLTFDLNKPFAQPAQPAARHRQIAESGTPVELLGLLTAKASQLIERFGVPGLRTLSFEDLLAEGLSAEDAAKVIAGLRLSILESQPETVLNPEDAFRMCCEIQLLAHEELWVLNLNTKNFLINKTRLYVGNLNSCSVRPGEIFRQAIVCHACNIIVVHNHPSGDPQPSTDDISLTRCLVEAGNLLDITVLDHVIIGNGRWRSLKEMGLL